VKRSEVLDAAAVCINQDRAAEYGSAQENFTRIALLWAVILGRPIALHEVALCMDAVKTARLIGNPKHADSWVDKAGYSGLGGELTTE